MRRLLFSLAFILFAATAFSQIIFDLGLKAGVNTSNFKIDGDYDDVLNSDAITQMHWGAFGRVGFGRFYVQPEVYFSKKGGDLSSDVIDVAGGFDYDNVDVPLLLGYNVIKGKALDLRIMAGPVFSFVTDASYPDELEDYLDDEFLEENIMGIQYGLGIDVLFLTIDARMEHAGNIYDDPSFISGKATNFMLSVGFKIL